MIDDYDFKDSNDIKAAYKVCYACIIGILICIAITLLTGCKSVQFVPVPEYHHDSIYFTKVQFDSIWQHDSIYVREYTKGDTVYLEHTKWHTKYKEVAVHDTSYIERIDSVSVPVPVERKLSPWEQKKQDYGGWAIVLTFIIFIFTLYRLARMFLPRW